MAAVKRLHVYHHSANFIFLTLKIIGFINGHFENRVPLKSVPGAWLVLHVALFYHYFPMVCYGISE